MNRFRIRENPRLSTKSLYENFLDQKKINSPIQPNQPPRDKFYEYPKL